MPIKIRVHVWRAILDRLPTKDNLSKRGVPLPNISCPLCNNAPESMDHILTSYCKATETRRAINRWVPILSENCRNIDDLFATGHSQNSDLIKEAISMAYAWAMCKGRNDVAFNNGTFNPLFTANFVQSEVFSWICNRCMVNRSCVESDSTRNT